MALFSLFFSHKDTMGSGIDFFFVEAQSTPEPFWAGIDRSFLSVAGYTDDKNLPAGLVPRKEVLLKKPIQNSGLFPWNQVVLAVFRE
jgi:hypothetical protein